MRFFVAILFFISVKHYSQTKFCDYIVTNDNDTIVGIYRDQVIIDLNKRTHNISSDNVTIIKHNDIVYTLRTDIQDAKDLELNDSLVFLKIHTRSKNSLKTDKISLYAHKLDKHLRKDFFITKENDTVFGQIKRYNSNNYKLINSLGKKTLIKSKKVKEFRKDGFHYYFKRKRRARFGDKKYGYLKLIIDGDVKLYEYPLLARNMSGGISSMLIISGAPYPLPPNLGMSYGRLNTPYESHYYIERNNKFDLISSSRFYHVIKRFLSENQELLSKIKNQEFDINSVYYVIKYFNSKTKIKGAPINL